MARKTDKKSGTLLFGRFCRVFEFRDFRNGTARKKNEHRHRSKETNNHVRRIKKYFSQTTEIQRTGTVGGLQRRRKKNGEKTRKQPGNFCANVFRDIENIFRHIRGKTGKRFNNAIFLAPESRLTVRHFSIYGNVRKSNSTIFSFGRSPNQFRRTIITLAKKKLSKYVQSFVSKIKNSQSEKCPS